MSHLLKLSEWDQSYLQGDNFVFYPHEEVIRFFARYVVKRTGIDCYQPRHGLLHTPNVLDVGCGIGRHVIFATQMGVNAYGIDLSEQAIHTAKRWLAREQIVLPNDRLQQGSITAMPWQDQRFDFALSHGVFDSMYFDIACTGMRELARVMKPHGLFYCDLIAGDQGDVVVDTAHEQGTIQSYYTKARIDQLIESAFSIKEIVFIQRENQSSGQTDRRWHLVLERQSA